MALKPGYFYTPAIRPTGRFCQLSQRLVPFRQRFLQGPPRDPVPSVELSPERDNNPSGKVWEKSTNPGRDWRNSNDD